MSKQRIYLVKGPSDIHLVRAPSRITAGNFIASRVYTVELAEQDTIVDLMRKGHDVLDAKVAQGELLEPADVADAVLADVPPAPTATDAPSPIMEKVWNDVADTVLGNG